MTVLRCLFFITAVTFSKSLEGTEEEDVELKNQPKDLNKPPVKTIQVSNFPSVTTSSLLI